MPLLFLDERHKADLAFLSKVPVAALGEFARIAVEFIRGGGNPKAFIAGAAKKLNLSIRIVQSCVDGLAYLFGESAKRSLSEIDFTDSVSLLSFPPETQDRLKELYLEHRKELRKILNELALELPHYKDLRWRLDVQLASRTIHKQVTPVYLLKLETSDPETPAHWLQVEYNDLQHITHQLQRALREAKSLHVRRVLRNIK